MTACLGDIAVGVPETGVGREDWRIAVAQLGARRHYAVPRILHEAGLLQAFYTDLYSGAGWPARLVRSLPEPLRPGPLKRLAGRTADIPPGHVRQFPWLGITRRLRNFGRNTAAGTRQAQLAANRRFGRLVADAGLGAANAVYVFNGAGLEILEAARERGLHTILDQTSAPVEFEEQLAREERERWPEWEPGGTPEAVWRPFADRERQEWQLADQVICGSEHVRQLVAAQAPPGAIVQSVSYGIDASRFSGTVRTPSARPLRVLFVGHLRLLKGVQYLAEAARLLGSQQVQVRLVGQSKVSDRAEQQLRKCVELAGTVPRREVARQYDWADVFVLPSLSEGSAAVCYEALASGLPVITTPHAGSVVRDGIDGFIVPIRNAEQLADRLAHCACNRQQLSEMSANALERAREFTVTGYAHRLLPAITEFTTP